MNYNKDREINKSYLSMVESVICIMIIVFCTLIIRQIAPFLYENVLTYPIITIFLIGGVSWATIRIKKLDSQYLFPRNKYQSNIAPFLLMTISFFLFARVGMDIEELFRLGRDKFLEMRGELIYSLSIRKGVHFLTIVIVAPIMEEILFRGLFLGSFLKRYSVKKSVIFSSLLFSVLHISPDSNYLSMLGITFLSGVFYAWLVLKTKNIKISIGCHIFWNLLNYILPMVVIIFNGRVRNIVDVILLFSIMAAVAVILLYVGSKWFKKQYSPPQSHS